MKEDKNKLLDYLLGFVSENKKQKMKALLQQRTRMVTIVLEDVYQSHNASAILRTAECLGIQDIHIIQTRNRFNAKREVAMGASKWLSLFTYDSVASCYKKLHERGYTILATSPHKQAHALKDLAVSTRTAFVFGTEEQGLSKQALEAADGFVAIDMYGFTESFNVSVSVGICLYHTLLQVRNNNQEWHLSPKEQSALHLAWVKAAVKESRLLEEHFLRDETKKAT